MCALRRCGRIDEIEHLLRLGHWPQAAGAELRAHVQSCRGCSERVRVTEALREMRGSSMREARLEPAALVWWRAQLRRRREVMQRVERPMRAQMFVVLGVVCIGLGLTFRLTGGASGWRELMHGGLEAVVRSSVGMFGTGVVVASAVALAMMAGIAVYLSLERE